jgi:hypothetical protein
MQLRDVHEVTVDRARNRADITRINPTRTYYRASTGGGIYQITWQNGHFFGPDGRELPESDIPQDIIADLKANPVTVTSDGPEVTKVCNLCKTQVNSSQLESHLYEHIRALGETAGVVSSRADAKTDDGVKKG